MTDTVPDAPDGAAVSVITDHPFIPAGDWWSRCQVCKCSEAAHTHSTRAEPSLFVLQLIADLGLDAWSGWILGGSGILALRDIRTIRDLDLYVDRDLYRILTADPKWIEFNPNPHDPIGHSRLPWLERVQNHVSCFASREWKHQGAPQRVDVQSYIDQPEMVQGIPCLPLFVLTEWKKAIGRPKDLRDLKLIDYYSQHGRPYPSEIPGSGPYRCPDCVMSDREVCTHGRT